MADATKNIGRFEIVRTLGRGAQSVVYLAFDPSLQREVAIKTLHFSEESDRRERVRALVQEAHLVSQMHHPNIVPIFEIGEHEGDPYLVFEHINGPDLAEVLRGRGALPAAEGVEIMLAVLAAVAHAHHNGIIHRDLKPSNILIGPEGIPKVMDFGISTRISDDPLENFGLSGTPSYMAPEYIQSMTISAANDIFAAGLILGEILTGQKMIPGNKASHIMNYIVTETLTLPAGSESTIDEKLGDIILKAVARNPLDRYPNAVAMLDALRAYLLDGEQQEAPPATGAKQGTLDFLLRRMRHKSDFPALSESLSAINRISPEKESIDTLSNLILKDYALTFKILKVVNTVLYRPYGGGTIGTISRAVAILGFNSVRNIALTLILFEHLQNKSHAAQLKDEFLRTLFAAILAREIAARRGMKNSEEVFVCTLFYNLGRLLAMFYFPEEAAAITKLMAQKGSSEDTASAQILGISFEEMGIGVVRAWEFPEQIPHNMRRLDADTVRPPRTPQDNLRIIAGFASELCYSIATTPTDHKHKVIKQIVARFNEQMPIDEKYLHEALENSLEEIAQYAATLQTSFQLSPFGKQLRLWVGRTDKKKNGAAAEDDITLNLLTPTLDGAEKKPQSGEAQAILATGIQDISNSLVDNSSVNDILRMILEIMYRSMGFEHVLLCILDSRQDTMQGRFGFGAEVDRLAANFRFSLDDNENIFTAALFNDADILISDINDPKILPHIPDWYHKNVASQTFMLLPINLQNTPMALIFADKKKAGDIVISENELNQIRTLRNQAILAFRLAS
jgi:serine/threonine protein kinase